MKKKDLLLDLYEPQGKMVPRQCPGMILLHGGGFTVGYKSMKSVADLCYEMASRGYVCVSIDYRLHDDNLQREPVIMAIEDATAAVNWMIDNSEKYHISRNHLVLGGSSAGAITAMLMAYDNRVKQLPLQLIIDLWGSIKINPKHIRNEGPPIIIVHGKKDIRVDFTEAEKVAKGAEERKIPYEFIAVPNADHEMDLSIKLDGITIYQKIADFAFKIMRLESLK